MLDNFNPLYSTDEIYRGADDTRCLTDDLNAIESDVETLETSKANINHIHTEYATSNHIHSYTDLLDKPTALPASGGNADTVDGKHASDFATTDDIAAIQALVGDTPISQQVSAALSGKVDVIEGKGLSTNDYTTDERDKLANIEVGAEVNQNAFYGIKVGSNTVAADTKTDTVTFVAGNNMTITPDIVNDKITFAATDTVYTHPTYTAKDAGLYKVAVDETGHVSAATNVDKSDIVALGIPAQDTTYPEATTSIAGLMSTADKTKLNGIATGANKYTLPTASSSTLGGVKTTSTVTSNSGYTACPIISGVPYYKDTNTTYTSLKNPYKLTMQFNGKTNKTYDGSSAQTFNVTPAAIGVADYVITQGITGDWTYRKWNSGVYECWRQVTGTITYSSTWNNFKVFHGSADWPSGAFKANPTVFYNCYIGNGYAIACRGGLSTTTNFKWSALGTDSDPNVGFVVYVYAIGRWK